jgi:alkane 1-monooxygenase
VVEERALRTPVVEERALRTPVVEERALRASRNPGPSTPDEVLATQCPSCGYTYDVVTGDEREGFAAGTAWADIPDGWCCPDCGVREKVDFVPLDREPAH